MLLWELILPSADMDGAPSVLDSKLVYLLALLVILADYIVPLTTEGYSYAKVVARSTTAGTLAMDALGSNVRSVAAWSCTTFVRFAWPFDAISQLVILAGLDSDTSGSEFTKDGSVFSL